MHRSGGMEGYTAYMDSQSLGISEGERPKSCSFWTAGALTENWKITPPIYYIDDIWWYKESFPYTNKKGQERRCKKAQTGERESGQHFPQRGKRREKESTQNGRQTGREREKIEETGRETSQWPEYDHENTSKLGRENKKRATTAIARGTPDCTHFFS